MTTTAPQDRAYTDIRDAVRALCAEFPDAYHREVDSRRAYPEKFVDALTKAGWMAALIPQEYGGSGLGLAIVRRAVDLLGHPLVLRSVSGQGSCFSIGLPLAGGDPAAGRGR